MSQIGIMQGRLSRKDKMPLQSFPIHDWKIEFERASVVGFDNIEWLVDGSFDSLNPIFSEAGRKEIKKISNSSGVLIESLCAHSFIDGALLLPGRAGKVAENNLKYLVEFSQAIGVKRLIIPAMDSMSLVGSERRSRFAEIISKVEMDKKVKILLESDLPGRALVPFIEENDSSKVGVLFDLGNANALALEFEEELRLLSSFIDEIHVKDRKRIGGESLRLGQADTPFCTISTLIKDLGWVGPFVLETPIKDDWHEEAVKNYQFTLNYFSLGAAA